MALALLVLAGLWAGLQNALAGGGSFLLLPTMMFTGMDALAANISCCVALFPAQVATGWTGRKFAIGAGGLSLPYTTREIEAVQAGANAAPVAYNSYAHAFAGMGVQFILMSGVELALGLLMMRRLGLWKRLRAAPLSRSQLLGSRIVASAIISLIVFAVIYAVAIAAFGVRVKDASKSELLMTLEAFFVNQVTQGKRCLLIVDEAQTLSPELLEQVRLLTNLETAKQKLLQIILIGQPELRDLLERADLRQIAQRVVGDGLRIKHCAKGQRAVLCK